MESTPEGGAIRMRRVRPGGQREAAITIARSGTARSNGFPQLARAGDRLIFAWTGDAVMTASMALR
jgi:hypothetical protein